MRIFLFTFFMSLLGVPSFSQFQLIPTNTNEEIWYISNIDGNIIVGSNRQLILKSTDGFLSSETLPTPVLLGDGAAPHRIDTNSLYITSASGGGTFIYKTVDNGQSWETILDTNVTGLRGLRMFDEQHGIVLGIIEVKIVTDNGGDSWYNGSHPMFDLSVLATFGDSIICAGKMNGFSISKDRANSWQFSGGFPINSMQRGFHFINKDTLLSVSYSPSGEHCLSFSTNGGANWKNRYFPTVPYFEAFDLHFFSLGEGYIVGKNGMVDSRCAVYKTIDTGKTWIPYVSDIPGKFFKIEFINDSIALIGGDNGTLVKWNKNSTPPSNVGMVEAGDASGISVYPNPSTGMQTLSMPVPQGSSLSVSMYDIQGRKIRHVYQGMPESEWFSLGVDISELAPGAYVYQIQVGNQQKSVRFVKK